MIVANLFFIKNTNGLFYYAADYLRDLQSLVREVLVRPDLAGPARSMFPGARIITCRNFLSLCVRLCVAKYYGDLIYTPTPHPLPFINSQWIVIHDSYPFLTAKGQFKRRLLQLSLISSRCRVGYINESQTFDFVVGLGVSETRLLFTPNKVSESKFMLRPLHLPSAPLKIGLVGTDSPKKCYDQLLQAVLHAGLEPLFDFRFYGHHTAYFEGVRQRYPEIRITLEESDHRSLSDFLVGIDVLVSVADFEGFGRPIATALVEGVPCYLLKTPVFLEFFTTAIFFQKIDLLVIGLSDVLKVGFPDRQPYNPPLRVLMGYRQACEELRKVAFQVPR